MDAKIVDIITQMVRDNKQELNKGIEDVNGRLGEIEKKVDKLLQFKWQIVGGSVIASAIFALVVQFFLASK